MTNYHVSRNGQQLGTFPEADARQYFAQGRIALTDLVWRAGMSDWLPAGQVFGAGADERSAAPPLPPPLQPAVAAPASGAPIARAQRAADEVSRPPDLHWALVLLLGIFSFGIFFVIWVFIQLRWVKRLDPNSDAMMYYIIYIVMAVVGQIMAAASGEESGGAAVGGLLILGSIVVWYVALYKARRSMIEYYNSVEPIALRLSGVMTFFFNSLYFQHHMSRIAKWKRTGQISPQ